MNIKKWFIGSVVIILSHIAIRFAFISQGYDITDSITTAGLIGMSIGFSYTSVIACIILLIIGKLCKDKNRFAIFTTLNIAYSFFVISGNYSLGDEAMSTITEEVLYCIVNIVIAYRIYKSTNQQNDIEQSVQKTVDQMKKEPKDDEKARNHKVDKLVTTEPAKFKTEHQIVIETQENEALSIMQEAQIPKDEPKEDQKQTQSEGEETNQILLSKMDELQIKLRHLKIICVTLAIVSVCLSGLLYSKSVDYAEKSADYENQEEFLTTYKNLASSSLDILDYYITNARFVYKGNKYHHAYGCPDVSDKTEYWIHNKEYCEYLGYTKCETCAGSSAYTITSTYMKENGLL